MGIQIRYGMVGGHMNAFIGEVHRKAIAFDKKSDTCFFENRLSFSANESSF